MSVTIEMPKLSDTMTEGTLVRWRKQPGDHVANGDILAEIETDKATMEMESFDDGILAEIYVQAGGKVAVGQKIGLLLAPGEKAGSPAVSAPAAGKSEPPANVPDAKPNQSAASARLPATPIPKPRGFTPRAGSATRVKASPLARKIAAEKKIDLAGLTGTGPGGRIVSYDVNHAASKPTAAAATLRIPADTSIPHQRVALSGMRKIIAERLVASKTQLPHFYLNIEVDVAELLRLRAEANAANEASGGPKLTINDFVLKAVIAAAVRVPKVNAAWDGDAVLEYTSVNLAVAVAIDDGLVTPVIKDAQDKSLREISETVKDLATRARGRKLKPEEYQSGTITVSNLGSYGIDSFSAIINPPQAAIIAVGAMVKKPVVDAKGAIVVGQRMAIGMSCDHRVVDGAIGAQYLGELRKLIENPTLMLL